MKNRDQHHTPCKRGHGRPSSYWMHDSQRIFGELQLKGGDVFLDLGCGLGEYALHASALVGTSGVVYAVDKDESLIADLRKQADAEGITNIVAMIADATKHLPLSEDCIDICLVATVLHIPNVVKRIEALCREIHRVLKPNGRLTIIECHKKDLSFGPPEHMRLTSAYVKKRLVQCNFKALNELDLGYNYMIQFARAITC